MKTTVDWVEAVKKWDELINEYGGGTLKNNRNISNNFLDCLEQRAKEEYENIVKAFANPTGDISKKYNRFEKALTKLLNRYKDKSERANKLLKSIEFRVVERCANEYFSKTKEKIEDLKEKQQNTELIYENSLESITSLKIDYINKLWFAELFEEERLKAIEVLEDCKKSISECLNNNEFKKAYELRKKYLITEKKIRQLEQGRDNNALTAVINYNQLVSVHETYNKARVFCSFLQKSAGILEQTYETLIIRWNEYKKAGSMKDVVESVRFGEVLKSSEKTFDENFRKDLPLIKKAEEKVIEKVETPINAKYESNIYSKAVKLKEKVINLTL